MKKIILMIIMIPFLLTCEKGSYSPDSFIKARIVGYDLNCSTCILEFPDDSITVKNEIGESQNNYYEALNLNKSNFEIGQQIKVKVRKSMTTELLDCITLYPSFNYKSIIIEDYENFGNIIYNDTINLLYQDCFTDCENKFYICFDTLLNDSRCPIGAMCIWAGIATLRFKFQKYNEAPIYFNLCTPGPINNYKIIDRFRFTIIDLIPYPSIKSTNKRDRYKAILVVTKEQKQA